MTLHNRGRRGTGIRTHRTSPADARHVAPAARPVRTSASAPIGMVNPFSDLPLAPVITIAVTQEVAPMRFVVAAAPEAAAPEAAVPEAALPEAAVPGAVAAELVAPAGAARPVDIAHPMTRRRAAKDLR